MGNVTLDMARGKEQRASELLLCLSLIVITLFVVSGRGGEEQGRRAGREGLQFMEINKTPVEPEKMCSLGKVCFSFQG